MKRATHYIPSAPFISVLVYDYTSAHDLHRLLKSLDNQGVENIELLLCGSNDPEIARMQQSALERDVRVRLMTEVDDEAPVCIRMETLAKHARGAYVCVLHGSSYLESQHAAQVLEPLFEDDTLNPLLVYSGFQLDFLEGKRQVHTAVHVLQGMFARDALLSCALKLVEAQAFLKLEGLLVRREAFLRALSAVSTYSMPHVLSARAAVLACEHRITCALWQLVDVEQDTVACVDADGLHLSLQPVSYYRPDCDPKQLCELYHAEEMLIGETFMHLEGQDESIADNVFHVGDAGCSYTQLMYDRWYLKMMHILEIMSLHHVDASEAHLSSLLATVLSDEYLQKAVHIAHPRSGCARALQLSIASKNARFVMLQARLFSYVIHGFVENELIDTLV